MRRIHNYLCRIRLLGTQGNASSLWSNRYQANSLCTNYCSHFLFWSDCRLQLMETLDTMEVVTLDKEQLALEFEELEVLSCMI